MSWVAVAIGGSALVSAGGAYIGSQANKSAADKASTATLEGAKINAQALADAQVKQEALSREGIASNEAYGREATGRFDTLAATNREAAAPATNYLRGVIANPGSLTPQQQQQLTDLRRAAGNQIRTSSIAGSGRTAASLLRRVESDFANDALEKNRARADTAAGAMYTTGTGAANSAAAGAAGTTADIGKTNAAVLGHVGDVTANLMAKSGDVMNKGTQQAGLYQAGADVATGKLMGTALGDVGSAISAESRASRYGLRNADAGYYGGSPATNPLLRPT